MARFVLCLIIDASMTEVVQVTSMKNGLGWLMLVKVLYETTTLFLILSSLFQQPQIVVISNKKMESENNPL